MNDMLVKLYNLPECKEDTRLSDEGIYIQRAMVPNKSRVLEYVREKFGEGWADECDVCFSNRPVSCFIAVKNKVEIVGFACYETTNKNFFGPTGVSEEYRGKGIGKQLFLYSLQGLKEMGYAYAIIGGAGVPDFYSKAAGAIDIPDSDPGIYKDILR